MESLVGRKIVATRVMTRSEMHQEGWDGRPAIAIELDDGTVLYPSQDEEGNGPGALFGRDDQSSFIVTPISTPKGKVKV